MECSRRDIEIYRQLQKEGKITEMCSEMCLESNVLGIMAESVPSEKEKENKAREDIGGRHHQHEPYTEYNKNIPKNGRGLIFRFPPLLEFRVQKEQITLKRMERFGVKLNHDGELNQIPFESVAALKPLIWSAPILLDAASICNVAWPSSGSENSESDWVATEQPSHSSTETSGSSPTAPIVTL